MKNLLILFLLFPLAALSQSNDNDAIKKVINQAFDNMREGDTIAFKESFAGKFTIQYISPENDTTSTLVIINPAEFMRQVATIKKYAWDQRIVRFDDVNINNGIAVVWAPYKFYLGKKLDHCGIDIFQLMKTPDGWRIVSLFYSIKTGSCPD